MVSRPVLFWVLLGCADATGRTRGFAAFQGVTSLKAAQDPAYRLGPASTDGLIEVANDDPNGCIGGNARNGQTSIAQGRFRIKVSTYTRMRSVSMSGAPSTSNCRSATFLSPMPHPIAIMAMMISRRRSLRSPTSTGSSLPVVGTSLHRSVWPGCLVPTNGAVQFRGFNDQFDAVPVICQSLGHTLPFLQRWWCSRSRQRQHRRFHPVPFKLGELKRRAELNPLTGDDILHTGVWGVATFIATVSRKHLPPCSRVLPRHRWSRTTT